MDSRILEPNPHAQFGGSLGGGMVGFPYHHLSGHHLSHHHHQHVYELAGHQLQSAAAAAVPFSIDGLLNGSCAASVINANALLSTSSSGCGMNGDNQYKLTGQLDVSEYELMLVFVLVCQTQSTDTMAYVWIRHPMRKGVWKMCPVL